MDTGNVLGFAAHRPAVGGRPGNAQRKVHAREGAQEAKWGAFGVADNKINGGEIRRRIG